MKNLLRTLTITGVTLLAATFSTATLAHDDHGHGHRKHDRFEERWDERDFRGPPGHRFGHHHHHRHFDERVVVVREAAPVYYAPPPVIYRPARPGVTISTADVFIPF